MRMLFALVTLAVLGGTALTLALGWPGPAQAQETEIQVTNHSVETNFPVDVKFYVEVAGPDEIEEVRVIMKTIGQTTRSAYRQVEFEPGTSVSGEAELLTSGNNYVPPGTRLAYSFEVTDKAGRTLRTEDEVFVYLDTRFEWFTVSEGIVTVYYNNALVKSRAEHVLETALASMRITGPVLGINPDLPLHIVTYHNYQDMFGALPFRSQATSQQLITQGMAFDEERVLMVHSGDRSVTGTTAHEFVHLLVGDALGRAYSRAPAWLNEGLAEYGSRHGGDRPIVNRAIDRAMASGNLRPLWHLGSYSGTPDYIIYAYAHGESVVTFMVQEYGEEKMAELMKALTRTFDIDKALTLAYGFDQHGLDSAWRQAIGEEPLPRPEEPSKNPLLQNIPDFTIAPILSPTFAPTETAPIAAVVPQPAPTQQAPDSTRRPTPTATTPPVEASVIEAPTEEPVRAEPEIDSSDGGSTVAAPGGCNPPAVQSSLVGELSLLLLLGSPLGLVMMRRSRTWKRRRD